MERSERIDRMAELIAQRAKRKLGMPRDLRLAGDESAQAEIPGRTHNPPNSLPDWSSLQPVDVSQRARKMHDIMVIANRYSWQIAITHFLMTKGVSYLSDLTEPQLDELHDRMQGYVDAAEIGASLETCLPAF